MRWFLILIFLLMFFFTPNFSIAATTSKSITPSISTTTQYIKARNTVRVIFANIKQVSKITYLLTYDGNGIGQGVGGSLLPGKKTSLSRDIYLGTCSGKVCTQHRNIKNIKLEVTTKFINGKSSIKTYKVK